MLELNLTGHIAVVTGGSGNLGRVICRTLAQCGADICVHYNGSKDKAEKVAQEIRAMGRRAMVAQADVGDLASVLKMRDAVEAELGLPLLKRTRTGARLTPEGERLMPHIRAIVAEERLLHQTAEELHTLAAGKVRVGTFTSVATHWLPAMMMRFQQEHPQVEFELFNGDYHDVDRWLADGSVDLVAAAQAPADECRTVGCVQACCLADLASGDVGDLGGALGRPVLETVLDGVEGSPALDLGAVGHLDLESALQGRGDLAILVVAVLVGAPGHRLAANLVDCKEILVLAAVELVEAHKLATRKGALDQ